MPTIADCFQPRALVHDAGRAPATSVPDNFIGALVLSGLGGVGKTQLAADCAERLWAAQAVDLLVWITASSREAIQSGYAQLAVDLFGLESNDLDQGSTRLLAWLASTTKRWLMVLDDLQNPSDATGLWPRTAALARSWSPPGVEMPHCAVISADWLMSIYSRRPSRAPIWSLDSPAAIGTVLMILLVWHLNSGTYLWLCRKRRPT